MFLYATLMVGSGSAQFLSQPGSLVEKQGAGNSEIVSDIDFDFWSWGMEKYDRAVAEFDATDFERLLEEARRPD